MNHPSVFRPEEHANYDQEKMGKATLFRSERMLVGLNAAHTGSPVVRVAIDDRYVVPAGH